MPEHFTLDTESTTRWCNHCEKNTRHAVSAGHLGRCMEHEAPLYSQKQLKAEQRRVRAASNPSLEFPKDQEAVNG